MFHISDNVALEFQLIHFNLFYMDLLLDNGNHWQPFIERQDMLVWRKEEPQSGGLYAYKVYGSFPDVSAKDFLRVQVDVEYRKEWDPTARHLEVIDTDPSTELSSDRCSDIVYWEMIWPVSNFF